MNVYIGNSIDEINEQDVNVEFCDELIDFIYKMSGKVYFDMSKLYQIDPYDDVEWFVSNRRNMQIYIGHSIASELWRTRWRQTNGARLIRDYPKSDDKWFRTSFDRRLMICIM